MTLEGCIFLALEICLLKYNTIIISKITIIDSIILTLKVLLATFQSISTSHQFSSVQFSRSVMSISLRMSHSTPGLPVHHQLPEFTQTHVHRVSDAIQPFHPLSSPSPPAPNPSQHQSHFQWVNSSHEVAKVLEFQL